MKVKQIKIIAFSILSMLLLLPALRADAQILEPVKWNYSSNKISANEYELVFKASIDYKWHLYSQDIPMSPPATTFSFSKNDKVELEGKVVEDTTTVIKEYDPNFDIKLKFYVNEAVFKQKVKVLSPGTTTLTGSLEFMSCNESKCLPPSHLDFSFDLQGSENPASAAPQNQILEPVKWDFEAKKLGSKKYDLYFTAHIDKGYHLYSLTIPENGPLPTVYSFEDSKKFKLIGKPVEVTKPIEQYDDVFEMNIKFFENKAVFKQTIELTSDDNDIPVIGEIAYMTCNETGCVALYNDIEFHFNGKNDQVINAADSGTSTIEETTVAADETKDLTGAKKGLWGFFFISFLGGFIAILTPCVFPMIPMTVSFFMKEGEEKSKGKFQALIYSLSIIIIYTFIGSVLAMIAGPNIANWLSTHWIPNVLFFLIFMIFAASFFGMFEITLPHWMVNKSDQKADKGGILGPVFMALTLVLVSFSCTGPIVGSILVASAGGAVVKPIIGMFGFSLAFAIPFGLFAFFPSLLRGLPKSGGWLNSVKVVLGFLELALGLKFLSIADQTYHWGILDREVYLALWIVIFFLMGLYLLGKIKFAFDSDLPFVSVPRLTLAIITFAFVIYMIPGMFGAPLKALAGYLPPMATHDFDLNKVVRDNVKLYSGTGNAAETKDLCETPKYHEFLHLPHGLDGYFDYDQAVKCSKEQNKPIFIDFTGHGCVNCREMEANVWSDPAVLKRLRNDYIVLALYVDDKTKLPENEWIKSAYDNKMKKTIGKKSADFQISKFRVNAQPYYVLMNADGEVLTDPRAYNLDVDAFINFLDEGKKNFEQHKGIRNINK